MRQLAKFSISVREEDFVLHLVDDAGEATDFACAPEQLDNVIDAVQERLLAAIDGQRSAGEILDSASETVSDEQGRQFFTRLWEHDLIVFDAKRP